MNEITQIENDSSGPKRLDICLAEKYHHSGLTRSFWTKMINSGNVQIDDVIVKKPGIKIAKACSVKIEWPRTDLSFVDKISVIKEADDYLVINKPAGILSHSKGAFNPEYTVADYVRTKFDGYDYSDNDDRLGIVHRLDRQTSGVMIAAKNSANFSFLSDQFKNRLANKYYVAIIEGSIKENELDIDLPISRDARNPKRFAINPSGKQAQTKIIKIADLAENKSVVLLLPKTGRTHQLRVHLSYLGYPILGDWLYGAQEQTNDQRFLLHAFRLDIKPSPGAIMESFIAPLANDMSSYINESDITSTISKYRQI